MFHCLPGRPHLVLYALLRGLPAKLPYLYQDKVNSFIGNIGFGVQ